MKSFNENFKNYLEIENILNDFFCEFNYCLTHCIENEKSLNKDAPAVGCCKDKYYKIWDLDHPSFELLKREREKLYGKPEGIKIRETPSPCEYHTINGCILKTHKSPVCISFLCRKGVYFLREHFKIFEYDYLGIYYALEWILTGDFSERQFEDFKKMCIVMIEKLRIEN